MASYKFVNNKKIKLTSKEEASLKKFQQEQSKKRDEEIAKEKKLKIKKLQVNKKLKDLGLDDDEIKALLGE